MIWFFLLLGGIFLSIVISTWKFGISPMPSSRLAKDAIIKLLASLSTNEIYELGSGWGGLAMQIAKTFPKTKVIAYEASPIPWLWSFCVAKIKGIKNLELIYRDFIQEDLNNAEVIVCYLYPKGMKLLQEKLKKNHTVISNTFAFPEASPTQTLFLDDFSSTRVYFYKITQKAAF